MSRLRRLKTSRAGKAKGLRNTCSHAVEFPIPRRSGRSFLPLAGRNLSPEMVDPVCWGDMGGMSNVNRTYYFRYFDAARHD